MTRLAHVVLRHRRVVVGAWLVLTLFGAFSASQVSKRWFQSFSIPGYSAYEANQRTLKAFGSGEAAPLEAVVTVKGDVTRTPGVKKALEAAAAASPGARASSYFTTGSSLYVSKDRHTTYEQVFPSGQPGFSSGIGDGPIRHALLATLPAGATGHVTGYNAIVSAADKGGNGGPSVLGETLIGGIGALIILLFVFGTLPAVAMPLLTAAAAILNTFTLVWLLTYITNVSIIVEFLIALVGLGVAIDYALLIIFRFREELRHGATVDDAVVTTMRHAGRSVIVSGSTVAVGLVSMVVLPLPFIRSIGIGGLLIPAVSVLAAITLLPAMLAMLGTRINRGRVMPKRIVDGTAAGAADGAARRGDRRGTADPRPSAQPEPGEGEGPPGRRRCDRGAHGSRRCRLLTGRLHAVRSTPGGERHEREDRAHHARDLSGGRCGRRRRTRCVAPAGQGDHRGGPDRGRVELDDGAHRFAPAAFGAARCGGADRCTRDAGRRRRRERRFRARGVRELPVRPAVRGAAHVHPARTRVPVDRAAAQGRRAEPRLARRRVRHRRLHLPVGPRVGSDLERPGHRRDHRLDSTDDLRVPLRPLDGLRGLHAHAHARGVRRGR